MNNIRSIGDSGESPIRQYICIFGKHMGNISNRHIASSFRKTFRFFLNMGINASQSYILNLFKIYEPPCRKQRGGLFQESIPMGTRLFSRIISHKRALHGILLMVEIPYVVCTPAHTVHAYIAFFPEFLQGRFNR